MNNFTFKVAILYFYSDSDKTDLVAIPILGFVFLSALFSPPTVTQLVLHGLEFIKVVLDPISTGDVGENLVDESNQDLELASWNKHNSHRNVSPSCTILILCGLS